MDKKKEANLSANTAQNFALVCMRFLAFTGSTSHLLSFVFNVVVFEKILKYINYVKNFSEAKLRKPLSK